MAEYPYYQTVFRVLADEVTEPPKIGEVRLYEIKCLQAAYVGEANPEQAQVAIKAALRLTGYPSTPWLPGDPRGSDYLAGRHKFGEDLTKLCTLPMSHWTQGKVTRQNPDRRLGKAKPDLNLKGQKNG